MINTALAIVKSRVRAGVAAISILPPGAPTGGSLLYRAVFKDGDTIDETKMSDTAAQALKAYPLRNIARINWGPETSSRTSMKANKTLPFALQTLFLLPVNELNVPTMDAESVAAYILGEQQKYLESNDHRKLPGSSPDAAARDLRYMGGGSEVVPTSEESPCREFAFISDWEVDYSNQITDPTVVM